MSKYIRNFLGVASYVAGSFALAKGERIVKISTTFLPSCNACLAPDFVDSVLTFGTNILNQGSITAPVIGVNECGLVSTADINNVVTFEFLFDVSRCNGDINLCDPGVQVAFEIESDNLVCPAPCDCEVLIINDPLYLVPGFENSIGWSCECCDGNLKIFAENLDNANTEDITDCVGQSTVLCSAGSFNWTPNAIAFPLGTHVQITIECCGAVRACTDSKIFEMVGPV
jgi:hypothetical protein